MRRAGRLLILLCHRAHGPAPPLRAGVPAHVPAGSTWARARQCMRARPRAPPFFVMPRCKLQRARPAAAGPSRWPQRAARPVRVDHSKVLHLEARGERLLELVRLVRVRHHEGVQVLAAAHLELGGARGLLDLDRCGGRGNKASGAQRSAPAQERASIPHGARALAPAPPPRPARPRGMRSTAPAARGAAGRTPRAAMQAAHRAGRPLLPRAAEVRSWARRRAARGRERSPRRARAPGALPRTAGVRPAGRDEEVLDLVDLLRLWDGGADGGTAARGDAASALAPSSQLTRPCAPRPPHEWMRMRHHFFFRRARARARSARGSPPRASPRDHRDAPRASRARIGRHSEPLEPAPRRRARVVRGRRFPRHCPTPTLARAQPPQNQRRERKRKKKKDGSKPRSAGAARGQRRARGAAHGAPPAPLPPSPPDTLARAPLSSPRTMAAGVGRCCERAVWRAGEGATAGACGVRQPPPPAHPHPPI